MREAIAALLLLCWLLPGSAAAQETEGVAVRALLFYSPTCSHCHQVIESVLLPMVTTYQDQLQILAVDVLAVLGLSVAAYLAYVEISPVEAVCGPVGQGNLVRSSPHARILGIPVAVLGLVAFAAMMIPWLIQARRAGPPGNLAASGLLALAVLAMLVSVYPTILELLVIRAVSAWCLSSAVIAAVLMLVVVGALRGWRPLRTREAWLA